MNPQNNTTVNMKEPKLSECLMLVSFQTSFITRTKAYAEFDAFANRGLKTKTKQLTTKIDLWPKSPATGRRAHSGIEKVMNDARAHYKRFTVPVPPEFGGRGLPIEEFDRFCTEQREFYDDFESEVRLFQLDFDEHLKECEENSKEAIFKDEEGRKVRAKLFRRAFYPDKDFVANEFSMGMGYTPIPDRMDNSLGNIANASLNTINESLRDSLDSMGSMVKNHLVAEIVTPLTELAEILADPDRKVRQPALKKIGLANETLKRLRLPGTDELLARCERIEQEIMIDADTLRKNASIKADVQEKTNEHIKALGSIFG